MKITLITPCKNADKFLQETLFSILSQRGDFSIQCLIADGGSSDKSFDIVREIRDKLEQGSLPIFCNDISVSWASRDDQGMYDAIANRLPEAEGDIVAYLNAGDLYLPNALSTIVEIFRKHPAVDWLTGYRTKINQAGTIVNTDLPFKYKRLLINKGVYGRYLPFVQQESTFFKRSLIKNLDLEKLARCRYAGDYYLWHQFAEVAELRIVKAQLGAFRVHDNQLSGNISEYRGELKRLASKGISVFDVPSILIELCCWCLPDYLKPRFNKRIIEM